MFWGTVRINNEPPQPAWILRHIDNKKVVCVLDGFMVCIGELA